MNLIWIISDTLRRDALGAYGNKTVRTPVIGGLDTRSMRFNRHYAAGFPTMPTRADFATGRRTISFMDWEPLPKTEETLPEILAAKGITTAAVVDTPFYVRSGVGYDAVSSFFIEIQRQSHHAGTGTGQEHAYDGGVPWRFESDRFASQTMINAIQWLQYHYKELLFLYIDSRENYCCE
jgi:arylsulfatase A-like enzyme